MESIVRTFLPRKNVPADLSLELIALYKEVQPYYDSGLKIPDDITLLFSDDNFGSLRRFPTEAEAKRPGGCGVSPCGCLTGRQHCILTDLSTSIITTSNTRATLEATDG